VNDSDAQAHALAKLLDGFHTHVNLIACNATSGPYAAPPFARQRAFLHILRAAGIMAHLRQPRGQDIEAACGQLRAALSLPAAVRPVQ
jgi:23S rRNA (adenine2503-C2)-methyltransferase